MASDYIPHVWQEKERPSAELFNHMEQGIARAEQSGAMMRAILLSSITPPQYDITYVNFNFFSGVDDDGTTLSGPALRNGSVPIDKAGFYLVIGSFSTNTSASGGTVNWGFEYRNSSGGSIRAKGFDFDSRNNPNPQNLWLFEVTKTDILVNPGGYLSMRFTGNYPKSTMFDFYMDVIRMR